MDRRIALSVGSRITFPGMDCVIEKVIGKGSNAIVYRGRYEDCNNKGLFHHVLIKELFPYHPKNRIYRSDEGAVTVEKDAEDFFELQRISFDYGNGIHLRMLEKYPDKIGGNINTFSMRGTLYSIMNFDGGRSLDKDTEQGKRSLRETVVLMKKILDALEIFHQSGYLHLDISPDNILITSKGDSARITLIDYNSAHKLDEIREGTTVYCSAKEGYTSPEVINMNTSAVSEASDLYSVASVFYWLLTGKTLSAYERLCKKAPDISGSALLKDVPDTVLWQAGAILHRGLATLPSRRYRSCEEMKAAVEELLCRIDLVGITHSSLWDSGNRMIKAMIRSNPSLGYLSKPEELYPMRVVSSDGESFTLENAVEKCLENKSAVLMGKGGMGKTTALLHTAVTVNSRYSAARPAAVYISLFDYNNSGDNFIKNRILRTLRFGEDVSGMEDARHRLLQELDSTLKSRNGETPKYLLLIDGFNEASGNTDGLMREILELSKLKGVRIILSTRSETDIPDFEKYTMAHLRQEDIRKRLAENALLYPEEAEIRELITIPLMLSIFCKAAVNGEKQLSCKTVDELMSEYLSGLCEKEISALDEDSPEKWSIEAAVGLVLPYICAELTRKNQLLGEKELLKVVAKCYRLLSKSRIASLFPQWIGHSKDIRNGCSSAEEWYAVVVVRILWRRMGLLIREQGGYRLMHQRLQEYLLEPYKKINGKVKKQEALIGTSAVAVTALAVFLLGMLIRPDPFDDGLTSSYFECVVTGFTQTGSEVALMLDLLEADENNSEDDYWLYVYSLRTKLDLHSKLIADGQSGSYEMAQSILEKMKQTGKVVPWSMEKLDEGATEKLFELGERVRENYGLYADILSWLRDNEEMDSLYGDEYRKLLREKLEADAALSDALYSVVLTPHLSGLKDKDTENYSYYQATVGEFADLSDKEPQNPDDAQLSALVSESQKKAGALEELEIFTLYRRYTE